MKKKLVFLLLLLPFVFSCSTKEGKLSETEKDKMKTEVKTIVDGLIKNCNEANSDQVIAVALHSPEFRYVLNGHVLNYEEYETEVKSMHGLLAGQKINILSENYSFPDNSSVLYVAEFSALENYKNGYARISESGSWSMLFKKTDNTWKMISGFESYTARNVSGDGTNGLNQLELLKQYTGTWKGEVGKDTLLVWSYDGKIMNNAATFIMKTTSKAKTLSEGRSSLVYDKKTDKFIETEYVKGTPPAVYTWWFTAKDKVDIFMIQDIANPDNAIEKFTINFESKDKIKQTWYKNNKEVWSATFTRQQ